MRERTITGAELRVSEIGFDLHALATGWWGDDGDEDAVALLQAARSVGITLFDASRAGRRGEAILARAFGRDEGIVRVVAVDPEPPIGRRARLGVDEQVSALGARLRAQGLDSAQVAVTRRPDPALKRALLDSQVVKMVALRTGEPTSGSDGQVLQGDLSLLDQTLVGDDDAKTSLLATNPLATGLLEGKYTLQTAFPPDDPRAEMAADWLPEGLARVAALRFLSEERPHTLAQACLRWVLMQPGVAAAVPVISSEAQLAEFVATDALPELTEVDLQRARRLYDLGFAPEPELAEAAAAG